MRWVLDRGCIIACTVALLSYANSFYGTFQFDDYRVIVQNAAVHSWEGWLADLSDGIRPLLKASYTLNWTSALGIGGFHAFNLGIHIANTALVFFITRRIFRATTQWDGDVQRGAVLLTALLFAAHPVQTEAVTYITGRSSSLMTLLYLSSLLYYLKGREGNRPLMVHAISPTLFAAAVAVKEPAVTLPFALVLCEITVNREHKLLYMLRQQRVHWLLLFLGAWAIFTHPQYLDLFNTSFETRSLTHNVLSEINGITYLISRMILFGRLNFDPDLPLFTQWHPVLVVELVFLGLLLAAGVFNLRKRPWLTFGILWFFLQLAPTTTLIPRLDFVNERHLYLSGWGLMLAFSGAMACLLGPGVLRQRIVVTTLVVLVMVLAVTTHLRNRVYQTEITLWEDTVRKSPTKARVHNNLGYLYFQEGQWSKARASYRKALSLDPDLAAARADLRRLDERLMDNAGTRVDSADRIDRARDRSEDDPE